MNIKGLLRVLTVTFVFNQAHALNICAVYSDNFDWFRYSHEAERKWGIDKTIVLAVIKSESGFNSFAMPVKSYLFGFIPWETHSSAFGYSQALKGTWEEFVDESPGWVRSRANFKDSAEFVAWYLSKCSKRAKIDRHDAGKLYLCYHEGVTGYKRKTYLKKQWLIEKSESIAEDVINAKKELSQCQTTLRFSHLYFL